MHCLAIAVFVVCVVLLASPVCIIVAIQAFMDNLAVGMEPLMPPAETAFTVPVGGPVEPPRIDKDLDAVKLFVGQVPKNFEEKDLRPYLEPYGPIYELSIHRDKATHAHKGSLCCQVLVCVLMVCLVYTGCAFVTFCSKQSAELAQQELHDKTILPNVS